MPNRPRPRPAVAPVLVALLLPALAACRSTARASSEDVVLDHLEHARYEAALDAAWAAFRERPDDPEVESLYRRASVAWLLERGRALTFAGANDDALAVFQQAERIEPDSSIVAEWIAKTQVKITERWLNAALEHESSDELEEARQAFFEALVHDPDSVRALAGAARMTVLIAHRAGLGDTYYNSGVRALSGYQIEQARAGFDRAEKYHHAPERTERRRSQVRALQGEQRMAIAEALAADGLWAAARNEYRLALAYDPELEPAKEGFERMAREAEANRLLEAAKMHILRQRFDEAEAELTRGRALTKRQLEFFDGVADSIESARNEAAYQAALTLENDYRFPEAIAAYGRLLDRAQFYKDVRARKDTLEEYVHLAADLWRKAEHESDPAKRRDLYEQIEIFWPEYRDLQDRLSALR